MDIIDLVFITQKFREFPLFHVSPYFKHSRSVKCSEVDLVCVILVSSEGNLSC